jgi:hypothetical protein
MSQKARPASSIPQVGGVVKMVFFTFAAGCAIMTADVTKSEVCRVEIFVGTIIILYYIWKVLSGRGIR